MSSRVVPLNPIDLVVGTGIIFVAKWYSDAAGTVLADPTTITFRVQLPSDTTDDVAYVFGTASEVTKVAVGHYEFRYAAQESGDVDYRAVAEGAIEDAKEWRIRYRATRFDATPGPGA